MSSKAEIAWLTACMGGRHTWYALSMRPPWQPLSSSLSQSTSSCSERLFNCPVTMALIPSTEPVVLNAQQEPVGRWEGRGQADQ